VRELLVLGEFPWGTEELVISGRRDAVLVGAA
jgi:hypothetical protein